MASVGLLGIAVVVLLSYVGFDAPNAIPGRSYFTISAQFDQADNLTAHSQIREDGKLVGQVLDPKVVDGKAQLKLQLDPTVKPLLSSSTIEVRPRSAVGVRYMDIKPGLPGPGVHPLADGDVIPATQTKRTLTLDEALSTFDPPTQANIQLFFQGLGAGFAGRGQDINDLLGETPPMLQDTRDVLGAIADRKGAVQQFIVGANQLAVAADPVRQTIADGFAPAAKALRPFTQERTAVHDILDTAPPALSTVSARLPAVQPFLDEAAGFSRAIRPALKAGPYAFGQTSALLTESRSGLRNANATLQLANHAVDPTLRLLDTVRPVLPELDSTLQSSDEPVKSVGAYGCDLVQFGQHWGSMMHYGNQDGGALRFDLIFGPESLYGQQTPLTGVHPKNASPAPCTANYVGK